MEDDFHNYLPTVMFRGTPCSQSCRVLLRVYSVYQYIAWSTAINILHKVLVKILYHETIFIFAILQRGVYFTGGGGWDDFWWYGGTASLSTFEFPSRVNLSGPSLYCTISMGRISWCKKIDAVRIYASYRLN